MIVERRRQVIASELRRLGQVRTAELARHLGVSEVTVRGDLAALDRRGLATRTHGGAVAVGPALGTFEERMQRNADAKRRIGAAAARLVADNQTLVLDSGSTLSMLALQMPVVSNLVVATTAMNIAQELMTRPGIDVHMIGGRVNVATASTIGSDVEQRLDNFVAHQAFVGAHAIDGALDVVDCSHDVARTKRNLIRLARRVVLLADSTKWGTEASSKAFAMADVDVVVSDAALPDVVRRQVEATGVEVMIA